MPVRNAKAEVPSHQCFGMAIDIAIVFVCNAGNRCPDKQVFFAIFKMTVDVFENKFVIAPSNRVALGVNVNGI